MRDRLPHIDGRLFRSNGACHRRRRRGGARCSCAPPPIGRTGSWAASATRILVRMRLMLPLLLCAAAIAVLCCCCCLFLSNRKLDEREGRVELVCEARRREGRPWRDVSEQKMKARRKGEQGQQHTRPTSMFVSSPLFSSRLLVCLPALRRPRDVEAGWICCDSLPLLPLLSPVARCVCLDSAPQQRALAFVACSAAPCCPSLRSYLATATATASSKCGGAAIAIASPRLACWAARGTQNKRTHEEETKREGNTAAIQTTQRQLRQAAAEREKARMSAGEGQGWVGCGRWEWVGGSPLSLFAAGRFSPPFAFRVEGSCGKEQRESSESPPISSHCCSPPLP